MNSDTMQRRVEIDTRFRKYRTLIVIALVIGVAVNALFYWRLSQPTNIPLPVAVTVQRMAATGAVELCPGETLDYVYTLDATEPAVIDVSTATMQLEPGVVDYGSTTVREPFPAPLALQHVEQWVIPDGAQPGEYVRIVALAAPGRYAVAFGTLTFRVIDCEGE